MNRLTAWRPNVLRAATTVNTPSNYGLQGSAHDFRGRVQNLASPVIRFYKVPWIPQYGNLEPFTAPTRIPNPSPGVQQLQQTNRPQRTAGPLVFNQAGAATINYKGY